MKVITSIGEMCIYIYIWVSVMFAVYIYIYYTIIVFCWGQYKFLWTLKTIFTEAFRLRWILISKVHKKLVLTDTKDCNCFITLKWKVKVKLRQYEINHFIMTSYIMQWKTKVKPKSIQVLIKQYQILRNVRWQHDSQ